MLTTRQIRDLRTHKHMSKPGIYMMLGDPTDKKPEVYIGQAKRRKNGNGTTHLIIEHIDRGSTCSASGPSCWSTMPTSSARPS